MSELDFELELPEIAAPELPESLETLTGAEIHDEAEWSGVLFFELQWQRQTGSRLVFDESLLRKCLLSGTRFPDLRVRDVRLEQGDLSNAQWLGANLLRAEIDASRLTGCNLGDGQLQDVVIRNCPAPYLVLNGARVQRALFVDCDLSHSTFEGARLDQVAFRNCNLSGTRFSGVRLKAVDFRSSQIAGIQLPLEALRGAIIDPQQALTVAALTGVQIKPVPLQRADPPNG